jgi:hypothetical protein
MNRSKNFLNTLKTYILNAIQYYLIFNTGLLYLKVKSVNTSKQSSLNSSDGNIAEDNFVFGKYYSKFGNCFSVFKTKTYCNSLLRPSFIR